MAMTGMLPPQVRGFSSWPLWRMIRFLAIWTAVLSIPRAMLQGQPLGELDIVETLAWMWSLAADLFRWIGASTRWW